MHKILYTQSSQFEILIINRLTYLSVDYVFCCCCFFLSVSVLVVLVSLSLCVCMNEMNFLVSMRRTIFFVDHSKPSKSVLNCRYVQTMSPCKSSKNNFSVYRKFTFNENNKSRTKLLVSPPIIHFALRTVPWIHFIFIALGKKSEIFFKTICKIILRQ